MINKSPAYCVDKIQTDYEIQAVCNKLQIVRVQFILLYLLNKQVSISKKVVVATFS